MSTPTDTALADTLLVVASGIFLVALAYGRAREHAAFASPLFWTGEILMFAFVVHRVLCRGTSGATREALVVLYAGAQYMIRWAYSPDMFRYSDELQHLRSLLNVLGTHHLFEPNFSLPISPLYPGMENAAAEIAQVGQVPPFGAGLIVAGLSHLLLAGSLIIFSREVSRSSRVACLGALIYALNPNAQFFDSSFHYEAVALPFLVLGLFFAVRFAKCKRGAAWNYAGCVTCLFVVVITHHLTAIAAVVLLAILGIISMMFAGGVGIGLRLILCGISTGTAVVGWIYFIAPITTEYLAGAVRGLLDGLITLGQVSGKSAIPASQAAPLDRALSLSGAVTTVILLLIGAWLLRTREPIQ
ncbi:MAG: glycosyltransferase, partial [Candidatus Dormibacteraceae bacterium]